jgi:uncharacterized membrane protein (Fun14 family)
MVENKDAVESTLDKLKPIIGKLTFSGIMGYTTGYAAKTISKAAAFMVGIGFIGLQGLNYYGYINIDWGKVKDDAVKKADAVSSKQWDPFFSSFASLPNTIPTDLI